ncbi:Hypp333 [Branchiostoma lanceolatum]|uniref:Hypp333 protein n=1 Tax=Branchiostoma lanceolatum TaxID=7740 RepID=A0A8J9YN74_BRALA|nr:Hypp333 [Branchiostoma lanceolatum]
MRNVSYGEVGDETNGPKAGSSLTIEFLEFQFAANRETLFQNLGQDISVGAAPVFRKEAGIDAFADGTSPLIRQRIAKRQQLVIKTILIGSCATITSAGHIEKRQQPTIKSISIGTCATTTAAGIKETRLPITSCANPFLRILASVQ